MASSKMSYRNQAGFSLLEALIALTILAFGFLAISSSSLAMMNGNATSERYIEASVLAQSAIESLRYTGFKLDGNLAISSSMTPAGHPLANSNTSNDSETDPATLFASPDHAWTLSSTTGIEKTPMLDAPALTPSTYIRRTWTVRDNIPISGMKTVTVVVGWSEAGYNHYLSVTTAIQGQ